MFTIDSGPEFVSCMFTTVAPLKLLSRAQALFRFTRHLPNTSDQNFPLARSHFFLFGWSHEGRGVRGKARTGHPPIFTHFPPSRAQPISALRCRPLTEATATATARPCAFKVCCAIFCTFCVGRFTFFLADRCAPSDISDGCDVDALAESLDLDLGTEVLPPPFYLHQWPS